MNTKNILISIAVILTLFGIYQFSNRQKSVIPTISTEEPTNFSKLGFLSFPTAKDRGQDTIYFSYVSSLGAPTTTMELSLDSQSVCAGRTGALPCMAMSIQFSLAFSGKKAIVEGIDKGARLTVRNLRVLDELSTDFVPEIGRVYIPWMQARNMMAQCQISKVMQAHTLDIKMITKDNQTLYALEPVLDEVFKTLQEYEPTCGPVILGTE